MTINKYWAFCPFYFFVGKKTKGDEQLNSKRIAFGIALAVLVAFTAPAMAGPNTVYFTNVSGSAEEGGTTYMEMWLNLTDDHGPNGPDWRCGALDIWFTYDPNIGDITSIDRILESDPWDPGYWGWHSTRRADDAWHIWVDHAPVPPPPYGIGSGVYSLGNLTIVGNHTGVMELEFQLSGVQFPCKMYDAMGSDYPNQIWEDGIYAIPGDFEKELVLGWNLISLPLTPEDNITSAVLSSMSGNYSAVYCYNATSKKFEDVTGGTMDTGIGYFVSVTTAGMWSYGGTPYTSMSVDLKRGLNMVGWLDTSAELPDALDSIAGNYSYVAQWNSTSPCYEVYDANAPPDVPEFIDFSEMERGNGYWIAAKEDCMLTAS